MTRAVASNYAIRWLLLVAMITLFLSLDGVAGANHSDAELVVKLGTVVCLGGLLLLPTSRELSIPSLNALICSATFFLLLLSIAKGPVPQPIFLQSALAVFSISLLLHCLSGLISGLGSSSRAAAPVVLIVTILIGSDTLWMGPAVELFVFEQSIIDAIIASSPLSYLSVAAEYDYLRNEWFYRHSPFGSLRFSYPSFPLLTVIYLGLAIGINKYPLLKKHESNDNRFTTTLDIQGDIKR